MTTGDIILIPFPFAELNNVKVRPALVVAITADKYQDLVLCAISSVVPPTLGTREMLLLAGSQTGLRVPSVLKTDRIVTLKARNKLADWGRLSDNDL